MFRKLKKDTILYKSYLEEKERKKLLSIQEETELNVKSCFEKVKTSYRETIDIGVVSLNHGCGATYLSEILAVFLGKHKNAKTCLIEQKNSINEIAKSTIDVFAYPCDSSVIYKKYYDFLIRDLGVFDALSKNDYEIFKRETFKCLVSWPDEQSLFQLASFVENIEHPESFIYFFNMVPKEQTSKILNLMEDYHTIILPCTSLENIDKSLISKLDSIFKDEKFY